MAAEWWQVQIALEGTDWDALRRALYLVAPSEHFVIALAPGEEGETATLQLDVLAETHGEAEEQAEAIYINALREAKLPESSPLMLGARTPIFGPQTYSRLMEEARRLIESRRYEMAVIRVQTACELFAHEALEALTADLRRPDEPLRSLIPNMSLMDRRSRALLQAVTGSDLEEQEWWKSYHGHVRRRNGIVHTGLNVSDDEANASRDAGRAFIRHLGWLRAGQPEDTWARRAADPIRRSGKPPK